MAGGDGGLINEHFRPWTPKQHCEIALMYYNELSVFIPNLFSYHWLKGFCGLLMFSKVAYLITAYNAILANYSLSSETK